MSFILEALKKSEQERRLGVIPGLNTEYLVADKPRARLPLLVIAVLTNLPILVGLGYYWLTRPLAPASIVVPAPAATPASVAPTPVAPVPAPLIPIAPTSVTSPSPVAAIPEPPSPPRRREPIPKLEPKPEPKPETKPEPRGATPLAEMPLAFRQTLPSLAVNVHVYDDNPGQRFVLINMRRYREGDSLDGGVTLDRITPEGVILHKGGERFRINR